jgi:hypothetical protein
MKSYSPYFQTILEHPGCGNHPPLILFEYIHRLEHNGKDIPFLHRFAITTIWDTTLRVMPIVEQMFLDGTLHAFKIIEAYKGYWTTYPEDVNAEIVPEEGFPVFMPDDDQWVYMSSRGGTYEEFPDLVDIYDLGSRGIPRNILEGFNDCPDMSNIPRELTNAELRAYNRGLQTMNGDEFKAIEELMFDLVSRGLEPPIVKEIIETRGHKIPESQMQKMYHDAWVQVQVNA